MEAALLINFLAINRSTHIENINPFLLISLLSDLFVD